MDREFWLYNGGDESRTVLDAFPKELGTPVYQSHKFHVIEYSAYEALKARVAKLEEKIKKLRHEKCDQIDKKHLVMEREAKLLEVVRFYADWESWNRSEVEHAGEIVGKDHAELNGLLVGGKRARQCLKELGVE